MNTSARDNVRPFSSGFPQIDGYEIIGPLGQGGMAEVWLAQRTGSEQLVVIKRLLPRHATQTVTRKRILREAQLGALLNHPNVAKTVDAGIVDSFIYIATEYLPGKDLEALSHGLARAGRFLPGGVVARVMVETLKGLHAAHEARGPDGTFLGLVHRDLSPRNIQLSFDGWVSIIDFGLAHARIGSLYTEPGTVLGTYRYMSPEQAIGEPVDRRSDLFSLGTSMYELFTGHWLFDKPEKIDILRAIVEADLDPPSHLNPNLPKRLDGVIARAMAHSPSDRFSTAEELRHALEAALPEHCATPLSELADLLEATFPHDAQNAREHRMLAQHRRPRPAKAQAEVTRDQTLIPHGQISSPGVPASARTVDAPRTMDAPISGRSQPNQRQESTLIVRPRGPQSHVAPVRKATVTEVVRVPMREATALAARARYPRPRPGVAAEDQRALGDAYELIQRIGSGGMGGLYLAQRRAAHDLCVVKMMHRDLMEHGGGRALKRFEREAQILQLANHNAIPALARLEIREGWVAFMEMEYVPGANLAELAEALGGALPIEFALPLALEFLSALHHAHELRNRDGEPMLAVHRDISPQNLMVTFAGEPKLIDFGIAHRGDEGLTEVGSFVGKYRYASPEQCVGAANIDRRSDIYSFGITLFELLAGYPVIDPDLEPKEIMMSVIHERVPSLRRANARCGPELDEVLARACAKKREDRFSTALEFSEALWAASESIEAASQAKLGAEVRGRFPRRYEQSKNYSDWVFQDAEPSVIATPLSALPHPNGPSVSQAPRPSGPRPWVLAVAGMVLVGVGIGIGAALFQPQPAAVRANAPQEIQFVPVEPEAIVEPGPPTRPAPREEKTEERKDPPPPAKRPARPVQRVEPDRATSPPPDRPAPRKDPEPPPTTRFARACEDPDRRKTLDRLRAIAEPKSEAEACLNGLERALIRSRNTWHLECERCLGKFR